MNQFYIITNTEKDLQFQLTNQICEYLLSKGKQCTCQKNYSNNYNYAEVDRIPKNTECVIILGGDGTLIQAARDLSEICIPVLGVNIGTLGYLTEIDPVQVFDALDHLIKDEYYIDERLILEGQVYRDEQLICKGIALNDIVINRMGPLRIINFDIFVNNEYLTSYPADGLIVATPTGSTAYNLSAGGPIIKPDTKTIVMTPICPHVLNKSSVIFDGDDVLEIRMSAARSEREERVVTFDGDKYEQLISGDKIVVKKFLKPARLIRTQKYNFLQILRNKLS